MPTYNRRQFLKQVFGFSAAAALSGSFPASVLRAAAAPAPIDSAGCHLMAVGDFGVKSKDIGRQQAVSNGMMAYLDKFNIRPHGLALLGDNFYGGLSGAGVKSLRWQQNIEAMYPATKFPGPMYAMLGNHDYGDEKLGACAAAQLAYSKFNPESRWTMPAKWYRFDVSTPEPLATVLVLDSNYSSKLLTSDERRAQLNWFKTELARPRIAPWLFVMAHHPLYSNGSHGDSKTLVKEIGPLLRQYKVDLYLSGHDHDLQHIEFKDHPTSFVVSGGGGARAREIKKLKHKPYGRAVYGFTDLEIHSDRFIVRHIDANGVGVHGFLKDKTGVTIQ